MTELSFAELESTLGEALPERRQLALLNLNVVVPVNLALATNVLTVNSSASAWAGQFVDVGQS